MKSALITGITGQCGSQLAELLLKKDYKVYGTYRRLSTPNFWRLQSMGIFDKVNLIPADLSDVVSLHEAIKISQPSILLNAAAQSFVGSSFESPIHSANITGIGVTNVLEAIRQINPAIRMLQFSTSEMFGAGRSGVLNELSGFAPSSPYGCAKLYAFHMVKNYREAYGMFCSNAIMFNSEGPYRGLEFVTRKITNAVAKIKLGLQKNLVLGNLNAIRDWGYCLEYMDAIYRIVTHVKADDFVIATGNIHSVKDFVKTAFDSVDLDWKKYVTTDKKYMRPLDVNYLRGNYTKLFNATGWEPNIIFEDLVKLMVDEDLNRWKMWQAGKSFPWDAANYPNENQILSTKMKLEGI